MFLPFFTSKTYAEIIAKHYIKFQIFIHFLIHRDKMMMHETKSEYQTIFIVYSSKRPQIMYKSVEKHNMTRHGPRSSYMSLVCMLAGLV